MKIHQIVLALVVVPLLMAMHDGGCAANSANHQPIPEKIDGCSLVFHGTSGDLENFHDDLHYTFEYDGTVTGQGAGGTFSSQSYSYSEPVIHVVWGPTATETITLGDGNTFDYVGQDGNTTYNVSGDWWVEGTCEAIK